MSSESADVVESMSSDCPSGGSPTFALGMRLETKRIDNVRIPTTGEWELSDDIEADSGNKKRNKEDKYAEYSEYVFIIQRNVEQTREADFPAVTTEILINCDRLKAAIKCVMQHVQKRSWNSQPFKVDSQLLLAFLPRLKDYLMNLRVKDTPAGQDKTVDHLSFLIDFLETEYATTLREIDTYVSHNEVTFDLLWAIFIPHSVIFTSCETSSEPRAVRLRELRKCTRWMTRESYWLLICEYIDANDDFAFLGYPFGLATMELEILPFDGVMKIAELSAYPMQWHPQGYKVREKLVMRGHRWLRLTGIHHMRYNGVAYRDLPERDSHQRKVKEKVKVNGRIVIDRHTFADAEPNYERRSAFKTLSGDILNRHGLDAPKPAHCVPMLTEAELRDDDILLASPILYGFSLVEKLWLEFNVEHVSPIEWDDEAFKNIAINPDQKILVQSLLQSHAQDRPFDDFVQGKGLGLVINLFGPPGVGKSLTVEATSEYLRKPLYVVSAGDLGTDPSTLDKALSKIFALAPVWDAVVLIDEADVFLEERGAANVERNAMVAVFLRQVEYFRGILFLTTNRVKTFDQAFQSRIHLSLHFDNLSGVAREQLWKAFLEKARNNRLGLQDLTSDQLKGLSQKDLNGRQIKNVVKLAVALANHENERLTYKHLARTMDMTEELGSQRRTLLVPTADFQHLGYLGLGLLLTWSILYSIYPN